MPSGPRGIGCSSGTYYRPSCPAVTVVRLPGAALAAASHGYLGLGAQPPDPEWGLLLAEGVPYAERALWAVLALLGVSALTSFARIR